MMYGTSSAPLCSSSGPHSRKSSTWQLLFGRLSYYLLGIIVRHNNKGYFLCQRHTSSLDEKIDFPDDGHARVLISSPSSAEHNDNDNSLKRSNTQSFSTRQTTTFCCIFCQANISITPVHTYCRLIVTMKISLYTTALVLAFCLLSTTVVKAAKVVVLTDDNFEHDTQATSGSTTGSWLVLFYSGNDAEVKHILETPVASKESSEEGEEPIKTTMVDDLLEEGIVAGIMDINENHKTVERLKIP